MYISIISILAAPRKLEHQGCHGTIVLSVQVELDAITTHSKINVDNLVIILMEGAALRMPFVIRLLAIMMNTGQWYVHRST